MDDSAHEFIETTVRCLSGYRADERPVTFRLGRRDLRVTGIVESWYTPDHLYFKVEAEDGGVYLLRHHEYKDFWRVRRLR